MKRDYYHPNGVIALTQAMSHGCYCDEVVVVPYTWYGRLIRRIFDVIEKYQDRIARYDFETLDMTEGDYFPWWSLSWWWGKPVQFANRFFPRVDGHELREWPEEGTYST